MQTTTNYNLTKAEGTDTVNLLTQCYPNFDTIDAAMFANKQASVGTATEVTTGTVHAITRNNADSDVFRFTATSAWTAGDTMTLDGVGVTVHLADGTTPATGAYIIGAEVLGVVNGSLVTLFLSSAIQTYVSNFNSRSGVVSPTASDYDAGMIDYDNAISGLNATDVQGAIDEVAANIPGGWSLFDTETGSTPIIIPNSAKEVIVNVTFGSIAFVNHFIPDLPSQALRNGYYASPTNYANATYTRVNNTRTLTLSGASFAGTDYTATATVAVYVK